MKATGTSLLKFLQGPRQFIIPIYQRTYSWTLNQCQQFLDDVINAATDDSIAGHFLGSIVYIEKGLYHISTIPKFLVIDGQQRLVTLSLLLAALGQVTSQENSQGTISRKKINNYFLFNSEESGELRYKLLLTQSDKRTLINLLEGKELPEPFSKRIVDNYNFFLDRILKSEIELDTIYKGIEKLIIVDIALDRNYDNPQLIFESLNSTGLELSQTDLIRNYVLMGLDVEEQNEIYSDYWYPMERLMNQDGKAANFDRFMRDYLTLKLGYIPKIGEVYEDFKQFYRHHRRDKTDKEIMADVYRYSNYYMKFVFLKEEDSEIKDILRDINTLRIEVAYPFLMEVCHDYEQNLLSRQEYIKILRTVESYVFRRSICGIPTNSLNKTFATLMKEIDKENYLESFEIALLRKQTYRRFPRDDEFIREFKIKDVYNFRNRNYLLTKLENYDRKEKIVIGNYTIEHILPQNSNLSEVWEEELGENWKDVQATYLHTIGNLTLTAYNAELSDRPFKEKRDIKGGFADSPLHLNRSLRNMDTWNEETIKQRAAELSKIALNVWLVPDIKEEDYQESSLKEMLLNVFPREENLLAAKKLLLEIKNIIDIDQAQHILSVTYREDDIISVNLGQWLIIRFKRTGNSYEIYLCLNQNSSIEFGNFDIIKIDDFSDRWSDGQDIILVKLPWDHSTDLPPQILEAWKSAVSIAYQQFKNWTASSYIRHNQPELLAFFFKEDYREEHINCMSEAMRTLFRLLRKRVLNLDASVREEYKKHYIAYKIDTNFVDVKPYKNEIVLWLNMRFNEINDPKSYCRDVTNIGHRGNGDVELRISSPTQLEDVMDLVSQSFETHTDYD